MQEQTEDAAPSHPRRWWWALFLAVLGAPAAYLYVGRPAWALFAFIVIGAVSIFAFSDPTGSLATPLGFGLLAGAALVTSVFFVVDPIIKALRARDYRRRRWNHWLVYLPVAALVWFLPDLLRLQPYLPRTGPHPFTIPSRSMEPTLLAGDYVVADRGVEPLRDLERGDVVVYLSPSNRDISRVGRLIGRPLDLVQMRGGVVHLNGEPLRQREVGSFTTPPTGERRRTARLLEETGPNGRVWRILDLQPNGEFDDTITFRVPPGHLFFLGDHRDKSLDSRFSGTGMVPSDYIVGRVTFVGYAEDWSRIGQPIE